jgi:hypothetical protein
LGREGVDTVRKRIISIDRRRSGVNQSQVFYKKFDNFEDAKDNLVLLVHHKATIDQLSVYDKNKIVEM